MGDLLEVEEEIAETSLRREKEKWQLEEKWEELRLRKERSEEGGALSGDKPPQRQSEDPNGREAAPTFFPTRPLMCMQCTTLHYTALHCTVPLVSTQLALLRGFRIRQGNQRTRTEADSKSK